jgi:two-component system cell cycle sensor histidine kinase/response regulator CckA
MRFSSFLEHAPAGFALCQSPGNITSTNSVFDELLGLSSSPIPVTLADLIQPQDGCDTARLISELFRGTRESFQVECSVSGEVSKSRRWTVWATRGGDARPEFAVVMLEDLTGAAAAQQRLHQAGRLETIGRLAGGVAHDFNNVLTGVLLYCDLLLSVVGPADRARKYAEEIRTAGLQASGLVRQLLTVVRFNKSTPGPVSLNEVAEGMRNLLVRLIGDNIELKFRLDPALGLVKMDPAQAQQILLNLVLNARDALPDGGQISVETGSCKMQILSAKSILALPIPCTSILLSPGWIGSSARCASHYIAANVRNQLHAVPLPSR